MKKFMAKKAKGDMENRMLKNQIQVMVVALELPTAMGERSRIGGGAARFRL